MINIELIKHCLSCPNIDLIDRIEKAYSDGEPIEAIGEVYCYHKNVCEAYRIFTEKQQKPTINHLVNALM